MTKPFTVEQLRCLELARIIREGLEGVEFDMSSWCEAYGGCGTAGCIAGHACAVYDKAVWQPGWGGQIFMSAGILLGLSDNQAQRLFLPWTKGGPNAIDITPAMAAATLENYALTGKVEWK